MIVVTSTGRDPPLPVLHCIKIVINILRLEKSVSRSQEIVESAGITQVCTIIIVGMREY